MKEKKNLVLFFNVMVQTRWQIIQNPIKQKIGY